MATIKDLMKANLLQEGDVLIWSRRVAHQEYLAVVNSQGLLITADGKLHKTPSGAAKYLNGDKPVDGWNVWKVKETRSSLAELRARL